MLDLRTFLNDKQYEAATCKDQYLRIIAGAGSGKTRVLTYRIAHLIQNGVMPFSILAITFTNKAAHEIKERVSALLGEDDVTLCTIHSWCYRFLRKEISLLGYSRNFTIVDDDDQLLIMKQIFESLGLPKKDPRIKIVLDFISTEKTKGNQYKDIEVKETFDPNYKLCMEGFRLYDQRLREQKSLDFDDLLLKAIEILSEYSDVRDRYKKRYSHILVDEFQDINEVQFDLIKLLLGEKTSLTVVGDPDQTIYAWRGAKNEIMLRLDKFLNKEVTTVILNQNYRSTNSILKVANTLIANNADRMKKDLFSTQNDGEKVEFTNARTSKEEASYIVNTILDLHRKGIKYRNIAVLYRANYLTRELETQLSVYNVPFKLFGGTKFFQRREIKDVLAYINLLINPDSDLSLERIINVPKRNIGSQSLEVLKSEALENGQSLYLYLVEDLKNSKISETKKRAIKVMVDSIESTRQEIDDIDVNALPTHFENMLAKLGYFDYLLEEEDGEERKENVLELFGALTRYLIDNKDGSYVDFFANAMLQTSQDELVDGDFVSLMTVHIAKGLEFDYVFVYSLGEGIFPNIRSVEESKTGLEEERRLAYVAFTRAKKKLYLTSNQDYSYVLQSPLRPSRFIKEAGIQYRLFERPNYFSEDREKKYFEEKRKSIKSEIRDPRINEKNNITWKVGDRLEHNKFGKGEVVELLNGLIIVRFDDETIGKKTLIGTYFGLTKI